jgi:type I restriction enzyme R subunit
MTRLGFDWNEAGQSEIPAVEVLETLGYTNVPADALTSERDSLSDPVLARRLAASLKRLNPWLSDGNVHKAVRAITHPQSAGLLEANEAVHTAMTYGISLEQDRGDGKKSHDVRYFDFENPDKNDWLVTRQLHVQGTQARVIPDVLVFVNGIPLAVFECKSPTRGTGWREEAVGQLRRYQELEEKDRGRGAPRLFHTAQLLVTTCGEAAIYGSVEAPDRAYSEWKVPYPRTVAEVSAALGREASSQDVLLYGLFDRANLLDLVRNFVTFERDPETGRTAKKIPRYQQFAAVNKAVQRARIGKTPAERGGIVWHTQGSGKSLTLLWLATKLRRDPAHENPTLLVVTDRRQLDDQITRTFRDCGFPNPIQAGSVRGLRDLISGPSGKTILTTVQKFQEAGDSEGYGVLSTAGNIFVMTDEAHRTQYGSLAANLRAALPNAVFFGFTGTPIDKKDRSTLHTFGSYIDTYTIEQSVADGATVRILYEGRLPDLHLAGGSLDRMFDREFADRSAEEREAIRRRYGTEKTVAESQRRIKAIALDIVEHYTQTIQPNGFKAQIVAVSRAAAAIYKQKLDELNGPPSAVIISATNDDDADLALHQRTDHERAEILKRFLHKGEGPAILIVCDMLLTGFDAPVEQVMYLDAPLREHTLLQAIARVNRPAEGKTHGLVVDYWGVSDNLQEALEMFAPGDVAGAMTPRADELPRLEARLAAAKRFFAGVKDRASLAACIAALAPDDVRAEFEAAFRRFAESMDLLLPDPKAAVFIPELRWLGKVRQAARARYERTRAIGLADCGAKVRRLIEDAIAAEGIEILVKPIPLLSPDLDRKLAALETDEAKASEMEHALAAEIHVHLEEDPVFYESLRDRLQRILDDKKARRIDSAEELQRCLDLRQEVGSRGKAAEDFGLSPTGRALYDVLGADLTGGEVRAPGSDSADDEPRRDLAARLEEALADHLKIIEWTEKDDVKRQMRQRIKSELRKAGYAPERLDAVAQVAVQLLRARAGR